jgi:hypothetical protein
MPAGIANRRPSIDLVERVRVRRRQFVIEYPISGSGIEPHFDRSSAAARKYSTISSSDYFIESPPRC